MKKLFILALVCLMSTMVGQSDSTKSKITGYVSYGLSVTNSSDFKTSSYTGIEGGIVRDHLSLGAIFGRGSLAGMGKPSDSIENYFYEAKVSASYPIGAVSGNVLFGYGGYINTKHQFIEYGIGLSYTVGKLSYGATCSNWDGITYVTPSITFNF